MNFLELAKERYSCKSMDGRRVENEEALMLLNLGYPAEGAGPLANHGSRKPLEKTVKYI